MVINMEVKTQNILEKSKITEDNIDNKRCYYLDYLRVISIILLFPVHTFMIWNDYGQKFYVWGGENRLLSSLIVLINPWFMPILFVIAGMCARYSLEKRTVKQFVSERMWKLLIPYISGIVLLIPFQTFFARKFFDGYNGSLLGNIGYFFTHFTDLTGYDGANTPGQLWFILFLFIISLVCLLVTKLIPYTKVKDHISKSNIYIIITMFILVWGGYYIGNFGGFSLGKNLALYLLGYYFLSNKDVLKKIEKYRMVLMGMFLVSLFTLCVLYFNYSYYGDILVNFVAWIGSCALIGFAKQYLNTPSKILSYFNIASFPIYILHQSILVAIGYYTLQYIDNLFLQIVCIMFGSFVLSILSYEIVKRIPYARKLIGIR